MGLRLQIAMAVTKKELIDEAARLVLLRRTETTDCVEATIETMKAALERGEPLMISGFGKFLVRRKRSRTGRNPKSGERIEITRRRVVVFRASGSLKEKVNRIPPGPDAAGEVLE